MATQQVGGAFGGAVLTVILAGRLDAGRMHAYRVTFWSSIAFTLVEIVVALALALALLAQTAGHSKDSSDECVDAAVVRK